MGRLYPYLWVGEGEPPLEYLTYLLERHVFNVLPGGLRDVVAEDMFRFLAMMEAEFLVNEADDMIPEFNNA